jgi:hypothetical protein
MRVGTAAAIGFAMLAGGAAPATASLFTIDVTQDGSNVVAAGSGSIDLTGLTLIGNGVDHPGVAANAGQIDLGPDNSLFDTYDSVSGPNNFGPGGFVNAPIGSGDAVVVVGEYDFLEVPQGYTSGDALSDSATWDNESFSSLGLTVGTYTWTWDGGLDSLVLNIGVPEPASLMLLASGLLGLGAVRRCRRA